MSWPKDPARPESTLLNLTAYRPLALDATVTCAVARQAQATGPTGPAGPSCSPPWSRTGRCPRTRAWSSRPGTTACRCGRWAGCSSTIRWPGRARTRSAGPARGGRSTRGRPRTRWTRRCRTSRRLAGPDDAVLTVSRDGTELARATAPLLPSVDMLTTSVTAVAPGALRVTLDVDDEFTSSPDAAQAGADRAAGGDAAGHGGAAGARGPRGRRPAATGAVAAGRGWWTPSCPS